MAYRDVVLTDSPVDYYEMETSTGTDSGAGSRTLTLSGGITTDVAGRVGDGWSFDGVNDVATMATFPTLTNAYSFEAWVKAPSAQGMNTDYPTVIRRDGTDIVLLRIRGSALGVNPGQAEVYIDGTTLLSGASYRVDDGNWHHIVYTQAGNAAKLYIDGVQRATATTTQSTFNFGTSTAYVGGGNTAASAPTELFKGTLDEVAIYTTALSATRITAHYDAGQPVAGGYTGQAMTASASMPGGVFTPPPTPATVNAAVLTASADMPGGRHARTIKQTITDDTYDDSNNPTTNYGTATALHLDKTKRGYFALPTAPTLGAGETLAAVKLVVKNTVFSSGNHEIARITSAWTETGLTYNTAPTATVIGTQAVTASGGLWTHDITDVVSTTNFGVRIHSDNVDVIAFTVPSAENATTADRPYVEYLVLTALATPVDIAAQPMTASTDMPTATTGFGKTVNPAPMTATADMPSAIVVGERLYTHTAEPADAYADMPGGTFASPYTYTANQMAVDSVVVDPTIETAIGVIHYADPAVATGSIIRPALVNGVAIVIDETEDKYFQRVFALAPKVYQRLNDQSSTAVDRMGTYNGTYYGVDFGNFDGPDGRHSVYFSAGDYLEQTEPTGTNADEASIQDGTALATTLEFSFRTSKANAFLMAGADSTQTSAGVRSSYAARELLLKNGRLTFRSRIFAGTPDQIEKEFTGVRNLADGNWHHVVVRSGVYSRGEWAVELWIDGTFEIRRFSTNGFHGFPDYIGFRPNLIDGSELEALPLSQAFEGDMTEVVFYNHNNLATHDIARNYYAFMGWAPIEAQSFEASAALVHARGKGSQKKALYLYWNPTDEVYQNAPQPEYGISFDPMPGFVERATGAPNLPFTHEERVGDYHGLKVFSRSVRLTTNNKSYRDPMTDDPSLINLETDIDLDEYDVIMFKDWPDEGPELDDIEANFPTQKERLVAQLRDANDRGIGLMVTNPRMAVDLGVIDRVEFVGSLKESKYSDAQGAAFGLYDYGSAVKFPWNITASDGLTGGVYATGIGEPQNLSQSFLENKAYFYHDTNKNDRFRVRAVIEGLTDLPSYMIDEAVFHVDYGNYGWQGVAYKYLKREDGLQIGDEYIFHGSETIDATWLDLVERRFNRFNGTWATPPGHVKAGTIVTTFGSKHWVNKTETDNPYKDYATTIVLQPGDVLAGRPVGGRIFVNFSEQPSYGLASLSQEVPTDPTLLPQGYAQETTAQREWDWSWTRTSLTTVGREVNQGTVTIELPNGTLTIIDFDELETDKLSMVRSNQLFPVTGKARLEMTARAMYWLGDFEKPVEGEVVIRTAALTVTAAMPQPTVVGQKTATVVAQPALATAAMPRVEEDTYGDVDIRPLPMTVSATWTGYGKTVEVEPLEATAEMVEPFDAVHAEGEQVALVLHNYEATLYLKEEA